jgi:hypothetical protein
LRICNTNCKFEYTKRLHIVNIQTFSQMIIEANEIIQLRKVAPRGIYGMIAKNLGISRQKVLNELRSLKEEYDQSIAVELKRLVEEVNKPQNNNDATI